MSIQSEIDRINNAKAEIASAIESKGVPVAEGTSIEDLPALVRNIPQEGGESVNEIFWVTYDVDPNTFSISNLSHTYDEIMQVALEGKMVKGKVHLGGLDTEFVLTDLVTVGGYSGKLIFAVFLRTAIQNQTVCLYFNVKIYPNNHIENDIMIVNTTDL